MQFPSLTGRILALTCLLLPTAAWAQLQELSFCTTGIHPDGFLNWSQLAPAGQQTAVTQTVTVSGIPHLTATVAIQKTGSGIGPQGPLYSVVNSADLFVNSIGGTPVTVTFSTPVKGFSVVFSGFGRFLHGFHMIANDTSGNASNVPPPAEVDSSALEEGTDLVYQAPLQIESNSANLTSVSFGFDGDPNEQSAFDLINFRIDSGSQPDPANNIPTGGLVAWFRADKTPLSTFALGGGVPVNTWSDQSGFGHNATVPAGANPPNSIVAGHNCTEALSFNGSDALTFPLAINGWSGMTIVMAAQAYFDGTGSSNAALFWDENAPWGETFVSPFQSSGWYRFGTGEVGNQPNYALPVNAGGDFQIITTRHDDTVDSLYLDGVLAQQIPGRYSLIHGTVTNAAIGRGYRNTYFTGNIGEILIYTITH